ncbi:Tripartite DNA replication factor [Monosporozyma unispora]|nr:Tripartite DNA replication factor [Kazachstania unispora]
MSENGKRAISNNATKSSEINPKDPTTTGDNNKGTNKKMKLANKRTRPYSFAPTDTIGKRKTDGPGVLKSISVSQVRNTAPIGKLANKQISKPDTIQPEFEFQTPKSNKLQNSDEARRSRVTHITKNSKMIKRQGKLGESSPTEEVVWQYDPAGKSSFNKTASTVDMSDEIDIIDNILRNPSSTPLFNNRLRGILDFNNMSESNKIEPKEKSIPPSIHITASEDIANLIENGRDIDEILKDVNGNSSVKSKSSPQKSQRYKDIPSSPVMANEEVLENKRDLSESHNIKNEEIRVVSNAEGDNFEATSSKDKHQNSLIDSSDDDLLIQIFTQKSQSRTSTVKQLAIPNPPMEEKKDRQPKPDSNKNETVVTKSLDDLLSSDPFDDSLLEDLEVQMKSTEINHTIEQTVKTNEEDNNIDTMINTYKGRAKWSNDRPDLLLSATIIGTAMRCQRSSAIQLLFKDTRGDVSLPMTIGNIVHELLQSCLKYKLTHQNLTNDFMEQKLNELLEIYSFAIIVCDETIDTVRDEIIKTHSSNILQFINKFVSEDNFGRYVSVSKTRRTDPISITNIIDIEENIWSPTYGFKGFLDATVTTRNEKTNGLVPLEVKTGKLQSTAHEAQGSIYTLLLHDRYDITVDYFLLYYTRYPEMTKFPYTFQSVMDVMMLRNIVANLLQYRLTEIHTHDVTTLGIPSLEECRYCEMCNDRTESLVLHALLSDCVSLDDIDVSDYHEFVQHLKPNLSNNRTFFKKYNDLITKEESSTTCRNQQLFLKDSVTRETEDGLALSHLVISDFSPDEKLDEYFIYSFTRYTSNDELPLFTHSQIYLGDSVFISDEVGHFVLALGSIVEITNSLIVVRTKRQLLTNRQTLPTNSQDMTQFVRSVLVPVINASQAVQSQNVVTYRIDKNNIQYDMSTARFNLLNIFLPPMIPGIDLEVANKKRTRVSKISDGGDEKMRKYLVDNIKPTFIPADQLPHVVFDERCLDLFNENQVKAIDQAIRCNDYSLILGMPGTGKTTVIAELIRILAANGKSILLTSYTHSAVDNILLKLLDSDINMVRLGSKMKINRQTQKYMPKYDEIKSYDEFIEMIDNLSVVATTCLGINDILFSLRTKDFDYVILDEASQVSLPVALGPLRYGEKFIMVGDHFQLPPLVKNDVAREHGLEESLFKILSDRHPESMVELAYQYRMCGDIVKLSNYLIYEGKLKCGTEDVYNQILEMLNPRETLQQFKRPGFENGCWLSDVLNPEEKVVFIDYDKISVIIETSDGDNITNVGEVELIKLCLEGMLECGVICEDIGVMSLYRAQLRLLKRKLSAYETDGLEILTADQFQGRDKKCIIISMVRCNSELHGGALLKELRRVNVAMTRAKSKLIIVGSKKTIGSVKEIHGFMNLLEENKWMYTLPADALDVYEFAETTKKRLTGDEV